MGIYKLKRGGHIEGIGKDLKIYRSKDPFNNVVETEQDLAALYPEKFETMSDTDAKKYKESQPDRSTIYGDHPAPTPGTSETLTIVTSGTPESLDQQAEELERKAAELREKAQQTQRSQEAAKQAKEQQQAKAKAGGGETWFSPGEKEGKQEGKPAAAVPTAQKATTPSKATLAQRWQSLSPAQQKEEDRKLEGMSLADLKSLADEEEVDLPPNATKPQALQALRQAMGRATPNPR